jgi:hypothetical protein
MPRTQAMRELRLAMVLSFLGQDRSIRSNDAGFSNHDGPLH